MFQGALSEPAPVSPRVVCLGETMVMFAPPAHELIEQSSVFHSYLGGSESNVAIGLERLGVHTGWIGKLTDNSLGRKIVNEMRSHGVDTSAVVWTTAGRVGTFFFEFGSSPRPMRTIYDRADSSAATLSSEELDWAYLSRAEWLHVTGITPALSGTCLATIRDILRRKHEVSIRISFDVNYRRLLWSREEAASTLADLLPEVDLLVGTEADLRMLATGVETRRDILTYVRDTYQLQATVMTLDSEGSLALDGNGFHQSDGYRVRVVNRLGSGDAFMAGLLYGMLTGGLPRALGYAGAMAALKLTIPQNTPLVDRKDVEGLLHGDAEDLVR